MTKILVLTTGGTIAGNVSGQTGEVLDAEMLAGTVDKALLRMHEKWNLDVTLEATELANIDSSDVDPELWTSLATTIQRSYDAFDGFVITHGTNTMGYTAAALSFAIENSKKPIVITGSQIPQQWPASDSVMNLENAIRVASYPYEDIGGVVAVFGSHIITGVRAKKSTEFDLDAFQTFSSASLGRLGRVLDLNKANVDRHQHYLGKFSAVALDAQDLRVKPDFRMRGLLSLTEFPGLSAKALIAASEAMMATEDGLDGVVFRAFGAGDVSEHRRPFLEFLKEHQKPIVVTTQAPNGKSTFTVNDPGQYLLQHDLAIPAHDMSIEAMTTKLGWLLAQGVPYSDMSRRMTEDLRGEINVVREGRW